MSSTPGASERARRLIALLGRFRQDEEVGLEFLAFELGVSAEELAGDLATLSLCGVAPYYPDQMVDVFVEDGRVVVYSPVPAVPSPVRLSASEARALVAALQVAGYGDDDPLVTGLLASIAVDVDAAELRRRVAPSIAQHDGSVFATLADAIERRCVVLILHRSSRSAGEASERVIEPLALFGERGAWYVQTYCRDAEAVRTFRLDRIESARAMEEQFEPRPEIPTPSSAFEHDGLPFTTLGFDADERFEQREWPGAINVTSADDGGTLVDVPYAGTQWVARQVTARLGGVRVLSPPEMRAAVVAFAESLREGLTEEF